ATSEEQYREAMMTALHDVERLSNTVRALLHLSQAESGQLTLQVSEFNLCALVEDLAEHFRILADAGRIQFSIHLQPPCIISGDRIQIERLVSNLLSNAIKYTPPDGKVGIHVTQDKSDAVIIVEDTGRGIPPEAMPHIFDRYYRVPGHRRDPE